jgi:hypothetical protein
MLPFIATAYALLFLILCQALPGFEGAAWRLFTGVVFLANVILALSNIIHAVSIYRKKSFDRGFLRRVLIFKLLLAPFFIINFIVWTFFTSVSVMIQLLLPLAFSGIVAIMLLPIIVSITYLIFLPASVYAIAAIVANCRNGILSFAACVVHIVLQLLFVWDIIGCIVLLRTIARHRKKQLR